jgi:hypothetical protein
MMDVLPIIPTINAIRSALLKSTEHLQRELYQPTDVAPVWTEFEWRVAKASAAMQGISSLLYGKLRWSGPELWRRFLREQRDQGIVRHCRVEGLVDAVNTEARKRGVALMALKGAALYARGIYAAGERPMADVDLLVHERDAAAAEELLDACNYILLFSNARHKVFSSRIANAVAEGRLGEHAEDPIKVELHTQVSECLPVESVNITALLHSSKGHPGIHSYPSSALLMLHLLLHAASNMRARALRGIQLHDISLLGLRFKERDWEELLSVCPNNATLWWAFAPLILTSRYYPKAVPTDVLSSLKMKSRALLRRVAARHVLTDVSWSNATIQAFPGIEWSRNPPEALRFMGQRLWPSLKSRLELKKAVDTIPDGFSVPWYGISHGSRIVRWIVSKPPRVQTLLSVRAALAQD